MHPMTVNNTNAPESSNEFIHQSISAFTISEETGASIMERLSVGDVPPSELSRRACIGLLKLHLAAFDQALGESLTTVETLLFEQAIFKTLERGGEQRP